MTEIKQSVVISDRNKVTVSGVNEIISCTDELIILFTVMGDLRIRGTDLELNKAFDVRGSVEISGRIKSLYFSENGEKYADNFFSRIFR